MESVKQGINRRKAPKSAWKPGQSGNPKGKPVDPRKKEAWEILNAATPETARKLADAAINGEQWAVTGLLDRTLGKPMPSTPEGEQGSEAAGVWLANLLGVLAELRASR